jgi:hypothetical protein
MSAKYEFKEGITLGPSGTLKDGLWVESFVGEDGGEIHYMEGGEVTVVWNKNAALAAAHGSGNRDVRPTVSTGNRTPPELSKDYKSVHLLRGLSLFMDAYSDSYPSDHNDPKALSCLTGEGKELAWRMMFAVLNGDSKGLKQITKAVELAEKIRLEKEDFTPIKSWEDIAEAIRLAAKSSESLPSRKQILDELEKINTNVATMESLVSNLGRMGFGWLGGKTGRPRKPKTPKPANEKKAGTKAG